MKQRIATKIGVAAALIGAGVTLLGSVLAGVPLLWPLLVGIAVGGAVYALVQRQVTDRLSRVDASVSALRQEGGRDAEPVDASGDEIERLIRKSDQAQHAVQKRLSDLSKAESYRREYVGDVSHEIKTPIFAIQGFAETLLSGALNDPEVNRGFLKKILHHANRLNTLAKDLAEISRLETRALNLSRHPFDLTALFEEVRESLEHAMRRKDVGFAIEASPEARWVDGDRERLRQVLTNLADNAVKYNNNGGTVRMRTSKEGDQVRVSVEDDGIGIAHEDLPRVTEPFYRADKSRSRTQGGTGLGLSIVKHILAAHGASLEIESTPGAGSTFSFVLPGAEAPMAVEMR